MKKQYVIVEHRNWRQYDKLREQLKATEAKLAAKEEELRQVTFKYGVEVFLNNELCDLCREHDVPFRPAVEAAYRRKNDF